ncbi:hypothetical protein UF10_00705 [Peptostreptococcus russellii]|uniref:Lipoprotein n=1 Tax=Peptostreptococcus russellii TaxID=215200 RepID=A0A2P7Q2X8_9FIRM|nr:hypothetical protein [Peptostreptococcus russellii]PSJ32318.1 hypothetical protein UF10_00705 [Peptostreptococcus russellii]
MKKVGLFFSLIVISLSLISCSSNNNNQKTEKDNSNSVSKEKKEEKYSTYEGEIVSILENDHTYSFELSDLSLISGDNEGEKMITSNDRIMLNISKEKIKNNNLIENITENEKLEFKIDSVPAMTHSIPPQILDSSIYSIKKSDNTTD